MPQKTLLVFPNFFVVFGHDRRWNLSRAFCAIIAEKAPESGDCGHPAKWKASYQNASCRPAAQGGVEYM